MLMLPAFMAQSSLSRIPRVAASRIKKGAANIERPSRMSTAG